MKHISTAVFCAFFAFAQASPFQWGRPGGLNSGEWKPPGTNIPDNSGDMSMGHMNGDKPDTKERFVKWLQEHKMELAKGGAFAKTGSTVDAKNAKNGGKVGAGGTE